MTNQKNTKLSVRLLKNIINPEDALKEEDKNKLDKVELTGTPADKILWAGQVYSGEPGWFGFFNAAEVAKLKENRIFAAGGGAVLFVRVSDRRAVAAEGGQAPGGTPAEESYRWMAVCFGMGYHALRPEKIEPNFGTIVALNKIGEDLIRSIDTKRPEDSTIQTRTQNSKKGKIFEFGIDTNRIILHSITGACTDQSFGTTLTGSEGLSINAVVNYDTAAAKCQDIYDAYCLTDYQTRFPWYGKIMPVKEKEAIDQLNTRLLAELNDGADNLIHLAPPDIVDFQDIEKFRYVGQSLKKKKRSEDGYCFDELNLEDFLERIKEDEPITLEILNDTHVQVSSGENAVFKNRWSVYRCLVCEIPSEDEKQLFVLSNGEWYSIQQDFVASVQDMVAAIPIAGFRLPDFDDAVHTETKGGKIYKSEGAYNKEVAEALPSLILCDRRNISFEGERGPVEFCDLLSTEKKIIHVKMRDRSSNLSHLFMQGYVSADAFRNSQPFRQEILTKIPTAQDTVPTGKPACNEYEIVFAFIHDGAHKLPFFSQIALKAAYDMITNMDYACSLLWIGRRRAEKAEIVEDEAEEDGTAGQAATGG